MAKKRTSRNATTKKVTKRKVTKKKVTKKKVTKRKVAAKQVAAKKAPTKAPAKKGAVLTKTHTIKIACRSSVCAPRPRTKHMDPGDNVDVIANGTNAVLTFAVSSPLIPSTNPIYLSSGITQTFVVGSVTGTFSYTVKCSACSGASSTPPEMIVD